MWVCRAVCKPFAMIVDSFAINVGLTAFLFAMSASPKQPLFASRSSFVCKPLHVGFHEGAGAQLRQVGEQFGSNGMLRHVFCHPVEQMMAAASFCGGGILERHPNLRAAFLEGNCSWLPFLMWRMDEHWERTGDVHAPELKMAPSKYWKRQCFASAEADEEPVKYVIDYIGNGGLVFSTDFPHGDSKFPTAVERFLQIDLPDEDKRK